MVLVLQLRGTHPQIAVLVILITASEGSVTSGTGTSATFTCGQVGRSYIVRGVVVVMSFYPLPGYWYQCYLL